jgi:TonB family protein
VEIPHESVLRRLDGPILTMWALTTGVLLLFFLSLLLRTSRLVGRWEGGTVAGERVLYSKGWGPAVVGFFRPRVVLPLWCRELDEGSLGFILDHEMEHVRAGDLRLLLLAGIWPIFFPWHLPLWWQLRRLRTAIEGDCDLRVLGRNPGRTRDYVDLLLAVGQRSGGRRPLAAMLSEPFATLKRRIRIMTMPTPKKPWVQGSLLVGGAVFLFAIAGWAPGPTEARSDGGGASVDGFLVGDVASATGAQEVPIFTPFSVLPTIKNPDAVVAAIEPVYASILEEGEVSGTVVVWLFVDEEGRAQRVLVNESSRNRVLDDTAVRIADLIELAPALNRDQPRSVWVSVPVAFTTREGFQAGPATGRPGLQEIQARARAKEGSQGTIGAGETGEVWGRVTNGRSGEPLGFVQLYVLGTGRGTLSGPDGRFVIRNVPAGDQEVVADLVGYGLVSNEVTVEAGGRSEVDFGLQVEAIGLETLVIRDRPGGQ